MRNYPIFVHQLSILLKAVPKRGRSVSKRASSSPERAKENKVVSSFSAPSPPSPLFFSPFSLSKPYWYRGIIRERDLDPSDSKGCHDVYIGILNRFYSTTRNRLTRHNGRLENDFPPSPWKGPNHHHHHNGLYHNSTHVKTFISPPFHWDTRDNRGALPSPSEELGESIN